MISFQLYWLHDHAALRDIWMASRPIIMSRAHACYTSDWLRMMQKVGLDALWQCMTLYYTITCKIKVLDIFWWSIRIESTSSYSVHMLHVAQMYSTMHYCTHWDQGTWSITKVVNEQNVTLCIAYIQWESNSNNNNYDFRDSLGYFHKPRHFVLQISSLTLTDKKIQ